MFSSELENISQLVTNFCLAPIHALRYFIVETKLRKAQQEILNEPWWRNVWVPKICFQDPKAKNRTHLNNNNDRNAVVVIVSANPSHLQDHNFECYGCYGNGMNTVLKYSYWGLIWWLWPFPPAWNAVRFIGVLRLPSGDTCSFAHGRNLRTHLHNYSTMLQLGPSE